MIWANYAVSMILGLAMGVLWSEKDWLVIGILVAAEIANIIQGCLS